jgi:LuxR family maltose regulon positive regulatory protein
VLMTDVLALPLILTKIHVPALRPRIVSRTRLIGQLAPETGTRLILVCAPAGYGKSTLLAEWAQSLLRPAGVVVAWYALDASDNDPIPFGSYLVASLAHALGPTAELAHIAQLLRSSPEIDLLQILPAVINAVVSSDRDCVLILDDYHLISAPAIHSALAFLLEHLPENMHIVIGSRSDPPLPLARLRARGQLLELRAVDLRFTAAETALFLNEMMQLDLSPDLVEALEARTEGWIAGLQLAALSLSGRSDKADFIAAFTGRHRYLVEYLLDEVINRQSAEVQAFLQSTSVLERLCGPLCDALLGEASGSEAILKGLEQANLFVMALDDQGYWYRYHHLFRDFLQTRLNQAQPERLAALHRAASAWYAAHDFLREAAQHAFQTHDWDYAAAFVEQHSFTLIIHSDISTIAEWCSAFPEEVMQRHPLLCLHQCWAWVFSFRRQNRSKIEARLQQAEQAVAAVEDKRLARDLTEQAAVIRSFLSMTPNPAADPREQLDLAQHVLESYPEGDASRFSTLLTIGYDYLALHDALAAQQVFEAARQIALRERLYFGVVESTFHLTRLAHSQGQLHRAVEICRQGQADIAAMLAHSEQELPALGSLDIALGCVLLEQDQLAEAEQRLVHGLDLIGWGLNPYYVLTACVALFRLREIQGRSAEALEYLTRLEEMWPDIGFYTRALRITHVLRTLPDDPDTLAEAATWCQDFSPSIDENLPPAGMGPFGAAEVYYLASLTWVRVQIAIGKAQAVWPYLERQLSLAEVHGLLNRVIELSLLEAQARRAEGDDDRTWMAIERALGAAQPEGYVRSFDQRATLTRLLVEAAQRGLYRDYIGQILGAIDRPKSLEGGREGDVDLSSVAGRSSQAIEFELVEHLSERELEVLRLVAQGASNLVIAEQLVITVGTVKSHINHILGKLAVHNRTEAVARARELGLLEI